MSAHGIHLRSMATPATASPRELRSGRALSALCAAFLALDGAARAAGFGPYLDGTVRAGFDAGLAAPIGVLLLVCTLLYALPRTAVLGALLLTAYLGAATAVNLRIGDPIWFPVVFAGLVWAGLLLREPRLRALLPLRSDA